MEPPILLSVLLVVLVVTAEGRSGAQLSSSAIGTGGEGRLRFRGGNDGGEFKILQVADMHYAEGMASECLDVPEEQEEGCSDFNTTAFIYRVIKDEKPDLVVFTGDNIFGPDASDAANSMDMAFDPVVKLKLPWAAVLGNHDQESTLSREGVMQHIVSMPHTVSRLNPDGEKIDGFGNYNLEIAGAPDSALANKSVLNLYLLDSGDHSTIPWFKSYGWIKLSQQLWFQKTSSYLQKNYMNAPEPQTGAAPGLAYFHIPLPEYSSLDPSNFVGVMQEAGISSALVNSGFFTTMFEAGDVKAVFTGHDHLNDFCGKLDGIQLCYAGGFGYHAYGKAGWPRRARVVSAYLEKIDDDKWGGVKEIKTWKRLDDEELSAIDLEVLWSKD